VRQRRTLTFALSGAAAAALLVVAGAVVVNANATPAKVIAVGNASESTPTDGSAAGQPADPPSAVVTNEPVPVPTLTGIDPEPTKTKKAKQPIIDVPTAIVTITPPANPTTSAPTAKPTQSKKPTSKPKRTDRVDPIGQETPTDDPSSSGQPTAKPTSKPTVKPTTKPTVKPTVKPTPKPTLKPNTASAAAVCGSGYKVIDSHSLSGKATIYLLYYSGKNCVVTMSRYVYPGKVAMNATLKVQKSGATGSDPGSFTAYAGPVRLAAAKTCVQWGGKWGTYSWTSGWSHCG
ncbi:MAG: hypothetical protein HOY71_40320, partial [Nonomuraea sp.]|nr:hypothetical protein [Nonomuraea sp.]